MRVISKKTLREFWDKHPNSQQALESWFHESKNADWKNSGELKQQYSYVSIINAERVVFNICGNKYRLIVAISYENGIVLIKFVGTHKEYNKVNAESI